MVAAAKEPRRLNGSRSGARPPCPPEVSATLIHSHFSSQAGVNAKTFGDFAAFQAQLKQGAVSRFGSGWGWLVLADGKLQILSTPNQDSPYMKNQVPILGVDVWEHAYYLKYQNKRPDYLDAWWNVVNWKAVGERYAKAKAGK